MKGIILTTILLSVGGTQSFCVSPADSISTFSATDSPVCSRSSDTIPVMESDLEEFVITTSGSRRLVEQNADGSLKINAKFLNDLPSIMGSKDPVSFIKNLPSALTTAELQPGLLVRGSSNGANTFMADNARIVNPMHMLGLYSAFNPSFYDEYSFLPGYFPAYETNATGGLINAMTSHAPDSVFSGTLNAGLVESNLAFHIPLKRNVSSLSIGARKTYINLLYPKLLRLGGSTLTYGFTDINATYRMTLPHASTLKASLFMSRDNMGVTADKNGDVEGSFGWKNLATSLVWRHYNFTTSAAFSHFNNIFIIREGGRSINLPSSISQATVASSYTSELLTLESDLSLRHTSGQHNKALQSESTALSSNAIEWNIAGSKTFSLSKKLSLNTGLRLAFYHNGSYNTLIPLPRLRIAYRPTSSLSLTASYSRLAIFDRLIEETTGGLPADFRTNASRQIKPEVVNSFELTADAPLPGTGISCSMEVYYKIMDNSLEFDGSILDFISPSFLPMDHILSGEGYAYGISFSASRQFGRLRGRVSYNYGRSMTRFEKYGYAYLPSSFDRPHDLNTSLSFDISTSLTAAASFTHATGTPYTAAKYAYVIGENIICEYYPHNSSRLPAYNRLDISVAWSLLRKKHAKHSLNFSIYNALGLTNVLFIYTDYSIDKGLRLRRSEMKNIIPSITYSIEF